VRQLLLIEVMGRVPIEEPTVLLDKKAREDLKCLVARAIAAVHQAKASDSYDERGERHGNGDCP
jgi:hypothetical protein